MFSIDDDYITVGTECVPVDTYYYDAILDTPCADVPREELLQALNTQYPKAAPSKIFVKIAAIALLAVFVTKTVYLLTSLR
ncbi:MAG TPA: hypothetical protein PLU67_07285 [Candidatus Kapabacteria bacterium]|nr:hypothetical protein [Candidatus Kapabacteria bacterium]HOM05279.1 hypothetical protein [Candidatus Kapabacteria bacterium]HPP38696.1 hypothetical protein [Candidatus Kapabacteria bacterium]